MPTKAASFDDLIVGIAKSLIAAVAKKYQAFEWERAYLLDLHSSDGQTSMGKFRVILTDGKIDGLVEDRDVDRLISKTWDRLFKKNKKTIWFGMVLTVYPDGRHEVKYNHDPNCIDDSSFIDF